MRSRDAGSSWQLALLCCAILTGTVFGASDDRERRAQSEYEGLQAAHRASRAYVPNDSFAVDQAAAVWASHARRLLEFADRYTGADAAASALGEILNTAPRNDMPEAQSAFRKLSNDYLRYASLAPFVDDIAWFAKGEALELLEKIERGSPHRTVQGRACYQRAETLYSQSGERSENIRKALELCERILNRYEDVPGADGNALGPAARQLQFEIKYLRVGVQAPELDDDDLYGHSFSLENQKGKLVILNFTASWCDICKVFYPIHQELVQKYPHQVLPVCIYADTPEDARRVAQHERLPGRAIADGSPKGTIARKWNTLTWPTLHLIDHRGVIRYKNVRPDDLRELVAKLISEMPAPPNAPAPIAHVAAAPSAPPIAAPAPYVVSTPAPPPVVVAQPEPVRIVTPPAPEPPAPVAAAEPLSAPAAVITETPEGVTFYTPTVISPTKRAAADTSLPPAPPVVTPPPVQVPVVAAPALQPSIQQVPFEAPVLANGERPVVMQAGADGRMLSAPPKDRPYIVQPVVLGPDGSVVAAPQPAPVPPPEVTTSRPVDERAVVPMQVQAARAPVTPNPPMAASTPEPRPVPAMTQSGLTLPPLILADGTEVMVIPAGPDGKPLVRPPTDRPYIVQTVFLGGEGNAPAPSSAASAPILQHAPTLQAPTPVAPAPAPVSRAVAVPKVVLPGGDSPVIVQAGADGRPLTPPPTDRPYMLQPVLIAPEPSQAQLQPVQEQPAPSSATPQARSYTPVDARHRRR